MMNFLFLDAYFDPELIAYTHLEHDLIDAVVGQGHEITVICPTPTRGISDETAKAYAHVFREELYGGRVHVRRFRAPREGRNPILRALRYFWCNLRTYGIAVRQTNCDIVFCNSTPPTQGLIAGKAAKTLTKRLKHKVPFVYNLQDVFPDSLAGAGISTERSLSYRVGRVIADSTYKACDRIITISDDIKNNIVSHGVPSEKVGIIRNWIDVETIRPVAKSENPLYEKYGIDKNAFLVVYAGNLGQAQNIGVILQAAKCLETKPDVRFIIFGSEKQAEEYIAQAHSLELTNVTFLPLQPYSEVSNVYSLGNVSIVSCKKGIGGSAMPSKTWSILAAGTPVLASFDSGSDLERLIRENALGLFSEADDAEKLAENIAWSYEHPEELAEYGKSARKYAERNVSRDECVGKFLKVFHEVRS